jgi:hypothetical protein
LFRLEVDKETAKTKSFHGSEKRLPERLRASGRDHFAGAGPGNSQLAPRLRHLPFPSLGLGFDLMSKKSRQRRKASIEGKSWRSGFGLRASIAPLAAAQATRSPRPSCVSSLFPSMGFCLVSSLLALSFLVLFCFNLTRLVLS